ncbi:MAG TPA: hypothetical protein GX702_02480 [Chloroflexi bacterium]|jgi:predicted  nucleic acid-binding Zn-ribbon protein|nr:hypothetical protein [Chloroflexota bacterium]
MAKTADRMNLTEYYRYLDEKRRELEACYRDVEEVQFQFNDIFKRELALWQEKFAFCYPRVVAGREELPTEFAAALDRVEAEEQERIRNEMADLDKQVRDGRAEMDRLTAEAQEATESLQAMAPRLNAEEQKLQARVVRLQDEYAHAFEEAEALRASPLGRLTNGGKIRRLQKAQRTARKKQEQAMQRLRAIRQEWQKTLNDTGERQSELREKWHQLSVEVARAQGQRDHLEANFDALAGEAAVQRYLEEMKEAPDVPGELGEALEELVRRNYIRWDYEQGLQSVAEALGMLNGINEGLKRFLRSVSTVVQEQRRYNLPVTRVQIPPIVFSVHNIWRELQAQVKDERQMGANPRQFSAIVERTLTKRLPDEAIQDFFEQMGQVLNRATASWKK